MIFYDEIPFDERLFNILFPNNVKLIHVIN